MGLVRESISFQRNSSKEAIKTTLFGFRTGQIVAQVGKQRDINSVFVIEYLVDSALPEIEVSVMGLGYLYHLNYKNPGDPKTKWFDFSGGLSTSLIDRENIRPISEEEEELIRETIQKKPQQWEEKKKQFAMRSDTTILFEAQNFQRGLSTSEIKDKLIGFRPGQLITHSATWSDTKPYKEVYMYIQKGTEEVDGETPIIASYIGALSKRDGKLSQFLARNKKVLGITPLWAEEKRGLTEEEMEKVKKTFSELPKYVEKIIDETGIIPSLNERLEFQRSSSEREIKEKLLGWRLGQILVKTDSPKHRRLLVFAGGQEQPSFPGDKLVIRCLEIGHVGGTPKIAYIHFGFTENILLKKKDELSIPNEEEIVAIEKALKNNDYQKYVIKAEEKIGSRIFV